MTFFALPGELVTAHAPPVVSFLLCFKSFSFFHSKLSPFIFFLFELSLHLNVMFFII